MTIALAAAALSSPFAGAPPAASAATDWRSLRTLNITHQGGEDEAPSNTMYAYARSIRLGADMLEVDVHTTGDGRVIALHDASVARTTDGAGSVYEMTLDQVQALDAAYEFVPGVGAVADRPAGEYVFRGVRTGERPPPPGFAADDFRIPTLEEVLLAYPDVPINIEIKGRSDADQGSFLDNAEALAATLTRVGRTDGVIVASFSDAAINYFHSLMPEVDLAPAIAEVAAFKLANAPPLDGRVAFQVPITLGGLVVTDQDFVTRAHAYGAAVHVWLSNDPEDEETYRSLLDLGVDGVMPAQPAAFERVLCERGVPRPPRPPGLPGRHCNHDRVSIACDVAATSARAGKGRTLLIGLRRRDEFAGGCKGTVRVRAGGSRTLRRFDFGWLAPSEGGPPSSEVAVPVPAAVRRALRRGETKRVVVRTRAYQAFGHLRKFRLR